MAFTNAITYEKKTVEFVRVRYYFFTYRSCTAPSFEVLVYIVILQISPKRRFQSWNIFDIWNKSPDHVQFQKYA